MQDFQGPLPDLISGMEPQRATRRRIEHQAQTAEIAAWSKRWDLNARPNALQTRTYWAWPHYWDFPGMSISYQS